MKSIPAALSWELFERGKWTLPGAFLTGNALTMVVLAGLHHDGPINPENRDMIQIQVTMLFVNATLFGAALFTAMGNPSRLRAFPAPSSAIVAWQLLPAMAVMGLECLLSAALFNAVFKVNWPLWGPALFMPVALAACAAVFWLTEKSPWHFFILGLPVLTGGAIWFHSRYSLMFFAPAARMWREVTALEVVTMLATAAGSYYMAIVGVSRSRCGEFLSTPEFFRWLARLLDPSPAAGLPFRTPSQAQFWFEWRQKGWALPAIVVMGLSFGFVGWLLFNRNPQELFAGATVAGALLPLGGLIIGLVFGNCNTNNVGGTMEMGHFQATRAMTSPDMSRTMLKAAGVSVLVAWVIWAAAFLALYVILLLANVAPRWPLPSEVGWWYFPLTLLGTWLALTFVATIGQTGRSILFGILFCGVPALTFAVTLISHWALTPAARTALNDGITTLVGVIFLLGTIWAFAAARRRSAIGPRTVWAATGVWAALCVLLVLYWLQHRNEHAASLPFLVHVIGLMALVVFPLAAGPLALAWNRNR
jgi:hypothetical protein